MESIGETSTAPAASGGDRSWPEISTGEASATGNDWVPWIFLSHSGAQKGSFVTHLYYALRNANHLPFFDMDAHHSLPIGRDYPARIFQACHSCKMGVIVLSEDYIHTLWPMLELQHLLLHGPSSSDRLIVPLFYELRPGDLSNPENLARWQKHWTTQAPMWEERMVELQAFMSSSSSCEAQINLDIHSWADNLKKLQYKSGVERHVTLQYNERVRYQNDYDYIQTTVSKICALLPPPRKYSLDDAIKGKDRMSQEIEKAFMREESLGGDGVRAIGVHGIGGSGKTILCKVMADFFASEFCGRCFYLEFPSNDKEFTKLLENIRSILPALITGEATSTFSGLSDMDQAMNLFEKGVQRNKVFLAIDNVWGYAETEHHRSDFAKCGFDYAKTIMLMKCVPGSKILVTSRSEQILMLLLESRSKAMQMQGGQEDPRAL